jgi:hypothetical protein
MDCRKMTSKYMLPNVCKPLFALLWISQNVVNETTHGEPYQTDETRDFGVRNTNQHLCTDQFTKTHGIRKHIELYNERIRGPL